MVMYTWSAPLLALSIVSMLMTFSSQSATSSYLATESMWLSSKPGSSSSTCSTGAFLRCLLLPFAAALPLLVVAAALTGPAGLPRFLPLCDWEGPLLAGVPDAPRDWRPRFVGLPRSGLGLLDQYLVSRSRACSLCRQHALFCGFSTGA